MLNIFDSDLDVLVGTDFASSVVFGQQTCSGVLDTPGKDIDLRSLGAVATIDYELTYRTTALSPAPKAQDSITVDGSSYIVRSSTPEDDGKLTKLGLKTK
jgi:hypothetical protein